MTFAIGTTICQAIWKHKSKPSWPTVARRSCHPGSGEASAAENGHPEQRPEPGAVSSSFDKTEMRGLTVRHPYAQATACGLNHQPGAAGALVSPRFRRQVPYETVRPARDGQIGNACPFVGEAALPGKTFALCFYPLDAVRSLPLVFPDPQR